MKNIIAVLLMLAGAATTQALAQSAEAGKEKMKIFSNWVGRWQGEGAIQMGPGEPKKSAVDERIETRLDGIIVVMEGMGKATDAAGKEAIVHHAFGVLSYDQNSRQYKLKAYLKDGRETDAWFNVMAENSYQWGFDFPGGKIRYSIKIDPAKKTWNEIGERSMDGGTTWTNFFEMNLSKIE
jgi:hypothetical protein